MISLAHGQIEEKSTCSTTSFDMIYLVVCLFFFLFFGLFHSLERTKKIWPFVLPAIDTPRTTSAQQIYIGGGVIDCCIAPGLSPMCYYY